MAISRKSDPREVDHIVTGGWHEEGDQYLDKLYTCICRYHTFLLLNNFSSSFSLKPLQKNIFSAGWQEKIHYKGKEKEEAEAAKK